MLYPFTFQPIFKERVWGGRKLEQLYAKPLPPKVPIGESWELCDRPGDSNVIANGPLAGHDLHWLMVSHASELLGAAKPHTGRFPLLIKILDAQQKLSLQVHPPAHKAAKLGTEPKTELWHIAQAAPEAEIYVGLKSGVTRQDFESSIASGKVADCFHRIPVKSGDAMFLPSGRVHALGAGLVIFEIQENSDTTYRVFDWNRAGLDGKPRALHLPESFASIDFNDFEPSLVATEFSKTEYGKVRSLVRHALFSVQAHQAIAGATLTLPSHKMQIIAVLSGQVQVHDGHITVSLSPGQFCLVPAILPHVTLQAKHTTDFLQIEPGEI